MIIGLSFPFLFLTAINVHRPYIDVCPNEGHGQKKSHGDDSPPSTDTNGVGLRVLSLAGDLAGHHPQPEPDAHSRGGEYQ
jgi:hypothetical protein